MTPGGTYRFSQLGHRTPVRPLNSSMIDQSTGTCLPRTIRATVHMNSALDPVTDDTNPASSTRRCKRVNGALKRIELVRLPLVQNRK